MSLVEGLVVISDLTGYAKFAARQTEEEIFHLLAAYYELVGDIVETAHGRVIKFMGDAALVFFDENAADAGVRAMLRFLFPAG